MYILMIEPLKISAVQFEEKSLDKEYKLSIIEKMCSEAAAAREKIIAFHECCISGYTAAKSISVSDLLDISETVPDGPSTKKLVQIAAKHNIVILAGLFEVDKSQKCYNTYICVD